MKVGEHPPKEKLRVPVCPCELPVAAMLTYERPGMLSSTVASYIKTSSLPLTVYDDGSKSQEKQEELLRIARLGVQVVRMPHRGFAESWKHILSDMRNDKADSVIMLEDDLTFAEGWTSVLQRMQRGISALGFAQGVTSCVTCHARPQNTVVDLEGIKAYQSMATSWQAVMLPLEALERWDVFEEALECVKNTERGLGLDVYYVGLLAHRLRRLSFVSTQSWVRHDGVESVVEKQGFGCFKGPGINLVSELL